MVARPGPVPRSRACVATRVRSRRLRSGAAARPVRPPCARPDFVAWQMRRTRRLRGVARIRDAIGPARPARSIPSRPGENLAPRHRPARPAPSAARISKIASLRSRTESYQRLVAPPNRTMLPRNHIGRSHDGFVLPTTDSPAKLRPEQIERLIALIERHIERPLSRRAGRDRAGRQARIRKTLGKATLAKPAATTRCGCSTPTPR